jgi:hypothetical protein
MAVNENDYGTRNTTVFPNNYESAAATGFQQASILVPNTMLVAFKLLQREREYQSKQRGIVSHRWIVGAARSNRPTVLMPWIPGTVQHFPGQKSDVECALSSLSIL